MLNCQKEWFDKFGNIIHIDATYKVNYENYILYIFLCQDSLLRGLPIATCYMRTETNYNMNFMYEAFNNVFDTKSIEIIMVDKDLQNIDLLHKYFNSKILICTFHVIIYIKSVLPEYELNKKQKHDILNSLMVLIYRVIYLHLVYFKLK